MRFLCAAIVLLLAATPAVAGTVSGTVRYENRIYNDSGFTGSTEYLPIRYADIEVIRSSDSSVLGSGETAADGTYSITIADTGTQTIFIRIYARQDNGTVNAVVMNNSTAQLIYTASSTPAALDTGASNVINLDASIAGGAAPAFNIFDCAVFSWQYAHTVDTLSALPGSLPQLRLYWYSGSTNGTYYLPSQNSIFYLGKASDPDEYDDDIVLHEMGHFMAFNFSRDDSPGGPHTIVDQLDVRFSWSEGWAHYWSAAARRHANTLFPGRYTPESQVDNFAISNSVWNVEIPSFPSQTIMATNEVAVAASLWDITDTNNEAAHDTLSGLEAEIWLVFDSLIPLRTQISLEDFTAGWQPPTVSPAQFTATTGTTVGDGVFKDRSIRYYGDPNEPNNFLASATALGAPPATLTQRTFYNSPDEDWFRVTLTGGSLLQVQTFNLGDGCDTVLEIYDLSSTLLASNDNRSPTDLSSIVQFSAPASADYVVRCRPYNGAGAAVEHGYYDISFATVLNFPPTINSLSASASSGAAPLRVAFDAAASDSNGSIARYQWDFDGDGRHDYESIDGASVVYTYARAGSYTATLRVTDNGGATHSDSVDVDALATIIPVVSVEQDVTAATAPAAVNFTANITGAVPVVYEWDFENDGLIDAVSVVSSSASHTYREGGGFYARVCVHDPIGRMFEGDSKPIIVAAGTNPPSVTSFSAAPATGTLPLVSMLSEVAVDDGTIATIEWDFDGDGNYDARTVPPYASLAHPYRRTGFFDAGVRVTDDTGLVATRILSDGGGSRVTPTFTGVAGWIVDPAPGDRISGTAVSLVAEVLPSGVSKKVQFQYRVDAPPGSWNNIGPATTSTGTCFTATWDVSSFASLSAFDVRVLIDDSVSSGDDAHLVTVHHTTPDVSESADAKTRVVDVTESTVAAFSTCERVTIPYGAATSASNYSITMEKVSLSDAPPANGSALGMLLIGTPIRVSLVSGSTDFRNAFRVRLHYDVTEPLPDKLEIHWYDETEGLWRRDFFSIVSRDGNWVEVRASRFALYALFRSYTAAAGSRSSGGCASDGSPSAPFELLFALLLLLSARRSRRVDSA